MAKTKTDATAFLVDGTIYDRRIVGGVMLLVDRDDHALAIVGETGPRPATPNDLFDLLACGRAKAVDAARCDRRGPLRGTRRAAPAVSRIRGGRDAEAPVDATRRAADGALTLGAFVHVSDAGTDALGGYEVHVRALAGVRSRNPGTLVATASPTAFRRRVEQVGLVLAASASEEGVVTVH